MEQLSHRSYFTYDVCNRLIELTLYSGDDIKQEGEQVTLYSYDRRGLVRTEINAKGDGKFHVYAGNDKLVQTTDEDGYRTDTARDEGGILRIVLLI